MTGKQNYHFPGFSGQVGIKTTTINVKIVFDLPLPTEQSSFTQTDRSSASILTAFFLSGHICAVPFTVAPHHDKAALTVGTGWTFVESARQSVL